MRVIGVLALGCLLAGCPGLLTFTFSEIGAKTVMEGATLKITLSAYDREGSEVVYSMENAPDGAVLDGNVFSWTPLPGASASSPYTVTFKATNHVRTLSQSVAITVTPAVVTSLNDAIKLAKVIATNILGDNPYMTGIMGVSLTDAGMPDLAEPEDNPGWAMLFADAELEYGLGVAIIPKTDGSGLVSIVKGDKYLLASVYPSGDIPTDGIDWCTDAHIQNALALALAEKTDLANLFETDDHDVVFYVGVDDGGADEVMFAFYDEGDIVDNWYSLSSMFSLLSGGKVRVTADVATGKIETVTILDKPEDLTLEEAIQVGKAFAIRALGDNPLLTTIVGVSLSAAGVPDATELEDNPGWALLFMDSTGKTGFGVTIHPDPSNPDDAIIMPGETYLLSSVYPAGYEPTRAIYTYSQAQISAWIATAEAKQDEFESLFTVPVHDTLLFIGAPSSVGEDIVSFSFSAESDIIDKWYIPSNLLNLFSADILTVYLDPETGLITSTDPATP
jgi:hypothetical protein